MFRKARQFAVPLGTLLAIAAISGCRTSPEAKEAKYLQRGQTFVAKKDYPRALLEFLRSAGFDLDNLEVEQFPAGHSNLTYLLHSGDRALVLRRPPCVRR